MKQKTKLKICGIYKIENLINNKKYIGQSVDVEKRLNKHKWELSVNRDSLHLQASYNKYGKDNFSFEIIEECTEEELDKKEQYYIAFYQTLLPQYGYNLESGGRRKGTISREEVGKRISASLKNVPKSQEHRDNLSEAKKEYYKNNPYTEYKKVVLLNTLEIFNSAIEAANKYNLTTSPLHRCCNHKSLSAGKDKDRNKLVWRYYTEFINMTKEEIEIELKKSNMYYGTKKKVRCIETNEEFDSIAEASRKCRINPSCISQNLSGQYTYAGKDNNNNPLHWEYV